MLNFVFYSGYATPQDVDHHGYVLLVIFNDCVIETLLSSILSLCLTIDTKTIGIGGLQHSIS